MTDRRVLVAGIGNIFLGDDAFGVEVAQRLQPHRLPEGVRVVDFGIRGYDLAYALLEDYDATIMVDAMARGGEPGTLYVIEPSLDEIDQPEVLAVEAHSMHPLKVLQLAKALGAQPRHLLVLGCEPATFGPEEGLMGLSPPVELAVEQAMVMIESLVAQILAEGRAVRQMELVHKGDQPV
ncbi:MAG: hydrogenase maturation protease [Herpetosiphonaceae bacterium]|nr:hydrogenase maturation protease [Herpetosiphonaceae bacterium]